MSSPLELTLKVQPSHQLYLVALVVLAVSVVLVLLPLSALVEALLLPALSLVVWSLPSAPVAQPSLLALCQALTLLAAEQPVELVPQSLLSAQEALLSLPAQSQVQVALRLAQPLTLVPILALLPVVLLPLVLAQEEAPHHLTTLLHKPRRSPVSPLVLSHLLLSCKRLRFSGKS